MTITFDPQENTWGFTFGTKQLDGYSTREAAAEALYDLEHGKVPALPPDIPLDDTEAQIIDWILARQEERKPGDLVKATLEYVSQPVADEIISILEDVCQDDDELAIADAIDDVADAKRPRVVTVEQQQPEPEDAAEGAQPWITYKCGEVSLTVEHDGVPSCLPCFGWLHENMSEYISELRDLVVLLADPRVRAVLGLA